jgi:hypothetical protein
MKFTDDERVQVIKDLRTDFPYRLEKGHGDRKNILTWQIESIYDLPEKFWDLPATESPEDDDGIVKLVAIIYTAEAVAPAGSFYTPGKQDFWAENFVGAPCRRLEFDVKMAATEKGCAIKQLPLVVRSAYLYNELREENQRCNRSFPKTKRISYPMPGSIVTFNWKMLEIER